ncbi:MAG: hypothetical protein HYW70_00670 [Candidatus Nealsonbacteria bacterium]|nr:hypothetical protein [Candidatus Nealsonbacteria bacterium]
MLKFIKTFSVFVGTIIGVGIFGLPYVALKAGFPTTLIYLLFLFLIAVFLHIIYGKVAVGTKELHRLPGYVGEYLGPAWKNLSFFIIGLGLVGALLAYLIIGGGFLNSIFSSYFGGNFLIYTLFFFISGSYLIFRGIKAISLIELPILAAFYTILALFFWKARPFIDPSYFKGVNLKFSFLPYGPILFSLWGLSVIPELKEMLEGRMESLKKVIIAGILVSAVTYLAFIFVVFGSSGPLTSEDAISGLGNIFGSNTIKLGFLFGVFTAFDSFVILGLTLKKIFQYDFGVSHKTAFLLTILMPLALFLAGIRRFIDVIGFTGAVAIGSEAIIVVFLYREFLRKKFSREMSIFYYFLPIFFVFGIIIESFYFFSR